MKAKSESEVAQSCPTPSDSMDCSLPGSSVHGIFQARVLEWRAIAFSEGMYNMALLAHFWGNKGEMSFPVKQKMFCFSGFRLVNTKCMVLVDMWKKIQHSNIVTLREVFTTKAFSEPCE